MTQKYAPRISRVRLPEGAKATEIMVLVRKAEWKRSEAVKDPGCEEGTVLTPPKHCSSCACKGTAYTWGSAEAMTFFSQPVTLGFDPEELPEEQGDLRRVFALSFAAVLWMAIGCRHLRSQDFTASILDIAWQIERAPYVTPNLLWTWARTQRDGAVARLDMEYWGALLPFLTGEKPFYYRYMPKPAPEGFEDLKTHATFRGGL